VIMAKANKGTTTKLAIRERITIFTFLNGSIIYVTVRPKPIVIMLKMTKSGMEKLKINVKVSFIIGD